MKKWTFVLMTLMAPALTHALTLTQPIAELSFNIPNRFLSSSKTSTYEWGCPVSEVIAARSSQEALQIVGRECMEEARRAANEKPGVLDVIRVSVIVPDVNVSKANQGFMLRGTFFLETLVLRNAFE